MKLKFVATYPNLYPEYQVEIDLGNDENVWERIDRAYDALAKEFEKEGIVPPAQWRDPDVDVRFVFPTEYHWQITQLFGANKPFYRKLGLPGGHEGVDFGTPLGTEIFSIGDGIVLESNDSGVYGGMVKIQHDDDFISLYGHLGKRYAKVGDHVDQGQVIALSGNTGRWTTGPHLHLTLMLGGSYVNPLNWL